MDPVRNETFTKSPRGSPHRRSSSIQGPRARNATRPRGAYEEACYCGWSRAVDEAFLHEKIRSCRPRWESNCLNRGHADHRPFLAHSARFTNRSVVCSWEPCFCPTDPFLSMGVLVQGRRFVGEDWRHVASPIRDVFMRSDFPLIIFVKPNRETSGIRMFLERKKPYSVLCSRMVLSTSGTRKLFEQKKPFSFLRSRIENVRQFNTFLECFCSPIQNIAKFQQSNNP